MPPGPDAVAREREADPAWVEHFLKHWDNLSELRETLPFIAISLPRYQRLMPLLAVQQLEGGKDTAFPCASAPALPDTDPFAAGAAVDDDFKLAFNRATGAATRMGSGNRPGPRPVAAAQQWSNDPAAAAAAAEAEAEAEAAAPVMASVLASACAPLSDDEDDASSSASRGGGGGVPRRGSAPGSGGGSVVGTAGGGGGGSAAATAPAARTGSGGTAMDAFLTAWQTINSDKSPTTKEKQALAVSLQQLPCLCLSLRFHGLFSLPFGR